MTEEDPAQLVTPPTTLSAWPQSPSPYPSQSAIFPLRRRYSPLLCRKQITGRNRRRNLQGSQLQQFSQVCTWLQERWNWCGGAVADSREEPPLQIQECWWEFIGSRPWQRWASGAQDCSCALCRLLPRGVLTLRLLLLESVCT